MSWYYTFVNLLLYGFIAVMLRHSFLRGNYFLHIFQQKGYKQNEYWQWMLDHWNQRVFTPEHVLFNLVILVMLLFMSNSITGSSAIVILVLFGIFWFGPFRYYRGEKQKKPLVFTPRMIRLCIPYVILALLFPVFGTWAAWLKAPILFDADIYILSFGWALADALMPLWVFPAATLMAPVEKKVHDHFIDMAKQKISMMPDLTIIAITGSYGKTSTKFMMRDLLSERHNVCSTPGSYNTPMGICKVINDDLEARHQVLILEMGARYEGNIEELCEIVRPDISVVTNVGVAHLETFGSREAIARTKATIVEKLNAGGTAVLNADDPVVTQMEKLRDDITVIKAGIENGEVRASGIRYGTEGTRFTVHVGSAEESFRMKLLGAHNIQNMLLAVAVGRHLGMRLKTMALAASRMEPVEHRLELKKEGTLYIIDDAFNSNPRGAKNAVEILADFETGRRIIVTPGMIELGELEEDANREFGAVIGRHDLDLVILVGRERTRPIREGLKQTGFDEDRLRVVDTLFEANDLVREYASDGDVVLYENDLPDSYDE